MHTALCEVIQKYFAEGKILTATNPLFSFYDIILRVDLTLTGCYEVMDVSSWIYVRSLNIELAIVF